MDIILNKKMFLYIFELFYYINNYEEIKHLLMSAMSAMSLFISFGGLEKSKRFEKVTIKCKPLFRKHFLK